MGLPAARREWRSRPGAPSARPPRQRRFSRRYSSLGEQPLDRQDSSTKKESRVRWSSGGSPLVATLLSLSALGARRLVLLASCAAPAAPPTTAPTTAPQAASPTAAPTTPPAATPTTAAGTPTTAAKSTAAATMARRDSDHRGSRGKPDGRGDRRADCPRGNRDRPDHRQDQEGRQVRRADGRDLQADGVRRRRRATSSASTSTSRRRSRRSSESRSRPRRLPGTRSSHRSKPARAT